jgi:hypothetical protein
VFWVKLNYQHPIYVVGPVFSVAIPTDTDIKLRHLVIRTILAAKSSLQGISTGDWVQCLAIKTFLTPVAAALRLQTRRFVWKMPTKHSVEIISCETLVRMQKTQ